MEGEQRTKVGKEQTPAKAGKQKVEISCSWSSSPTKVSSEVDNPTEKSIEERQTPYAEGPREDSLTSTDCGEAQRQTHIGGTGDCGDATKTSTSKVRVKRRLSRTSPSASTSSVSFTANSAAVRIRQRRQLKKRVVVPYRMYPKYQWQH